MSTGPDPPNLLAWARDRLAWASLTDALRDHRVPRRGYFFYLGGITTFILLMQVITGVLLTVYYRPDAAQAHDSVERIVGGIAYGHVVHAVHAWSADLFVACLLVHLLTIVSRRSFTPPQELTWWSGLLLLLVGLGLAFTGSVLPWSQRAYTNAQVGSEFTRYVPLVGDWLRRLMLGGDHVSTETLAHAFGFHVAVLPAALTAIVGVHFFFLARRPPGRTFSPQVETIPLYPDFLVRQAVAMTAVFALVLTLATFVERPIGPAADPRVPVAGALPPWYFLPVHALVRASPKDLLGMEGPRFFVGAACVFAGVFAALPLLDRRGSRVTAWLAWALFFGFLLLACRALY
jgi:quinol-cytochrome oxidoreductase complex cytochrome b subunit